MSQWRLPENFFGFALAIVGLLIPIILIYLVFLG
jgi:hypothetical protein